MILDIINKIKGDLEESFKHIFVWFDTNEDSINYKPENSGWSIAQILEHISITNHYLLILIKKGTLKAIEKSKNISFAELVENYELDWIKLEAVGTHKSFEWNRPEHMEPKVVNNLIEVREKLEFQLNECLAILEQMPNGEGILSTTTMSVNGLGKIDVYHYIYFLVQHAKRHLTQMQMVKLGLENKK